MQGEAFAQRKHIDYNMRGLYIHVPFCLTKCDYCDFYSLKFSNSLADDYTNAVISRLEHIIDTVDTVYLGGGTPSVIGYKRIAAMLGRINYAANTEITVECNPKTATANFLCGIADAGVNRISIGLQSANSSELKRLTRTHSAEDVLLSCDNARDAGIDNISLDLMLGIEGQTVESVIDSVKFCKKCGAKHVSAYMLKIEQGTPFADKPKSTFPDDDLTADLYETAVNALEKSGYKQYEISNFAYPGYESRHNLKYWNCDDYYGIGPAAHSFINGKRYYYPRDINAFIGGGEPIYDSGFGGFPEYAMLRLRLSDGLDYSLAAEKNIAVPSDFDAKCEKYVKMGLMLSDNRGVRFTKKGFLVQNAVLCDIL